MIQALFIALVVFVVSFAGLMLVEKLLHRLTHNKSRAYRWGVWLFSILLAGYALATSIGRH